MAVTSSRRQVRPASSLLISQVARGMRRRVEQAVAPLGLRPRELVALQYLRDRGPSPQQTLGELLGVDATNVIAILNRLEDADLVERRRDRADRRRAIVELSEAGEQLLAALDRGLQEIDDEVFGSLTRSERKTLNALLYRVADHPPQGCVKAIEEHC
jgi:MarR family transcriptional regulator, lower aerobic nicotinate degradation pathway regulator